MAAHDTKDTSGRLAYCPTCKIQTIHDVFNGRISSCRNPHVTGESGKQRKAREKRDLERKEPGLF